MEKVICGSTTDDLSSCRAGASCAFVFIPGQVYHAEHIAESASEIIFGDLYIALFDDNGEHIARGTKCRPANIRATVRRAARHFAALVNGAAVAAAAALCVLCIEGVVIDSVERAWEPFCALACVSGMIAPLFDDKRLSAPQEAVIADLAALVERDCSVDAAQRAGFRRFLIDDEGFAAAVQCLADKLVTLDELA